MLGEPLRTTPFRNASQRELGVGSPRTREARPSAVWSAPERGRESLRPAELTPVNDLSRIRLELASTGQPQRPDRSAVRHDNARKTLEQVGDEHPVAKRVIAWGLAASEIIGFFTGWSPADAVTIGEAVAGKTIRGRKMHWAERVIFGALALIPEVPSRIISEGYYELMDDLKRRKAQ